MRAKLIFGCVFALILTGACDGFCAGVIRQRQRMQIIQRQRQIMYQLAQLKEAYKQAIYHGNYELAGKIRAYYERIVQKYASAYSHPSVSQQNTHNKVNVHEDNVEDISDVIAQLNGSSQIWTQIIDEEPKIAIIDHYKSVYLNEGVIINKSSSDYIDIINTLLTDHPTMLQYPFKEVLKSAAISQNDFHSR